MTNAQRRTHLLDHGWHRLSPVGAECWLAPGWRRYDSYGNVEPGADRGFYSLAAAIRTQLQREEP